MAPIKKTTNRTLFIIFLLSTLVSLQSPGAEVQVKPEILINNLNHPWSVVFLDDKQLLISERNGDLLLFDEGKKIILDLPIVDIYATGQGGLLDLALPPNHKKTGWIYLSYSQTNDDFRSTTALTRFQLKNNQITNWQLLYVAKPYSGNSQHFGGRIAFDKLDFVYLSVGDRGNRHFAQKTTNDVGKILRLNLDGSIPSNNPFNNAIYSYGHRNPQGLIYLDNHLIAHEHGPRGGDELNIIQKGVNYGWPVISYGKEYISGRQVGIGIHKEGMAQPKYYWTPSIAPSGLAGLRKNEKIILFVGALKFKELVQLTFKKQQVLNERKLFNNRFGRIRDVKIYKNYLYLLTDSSNGQLIKISLGALL